MKKDQFFQEIQNLFYYDSKLMEFYGTVVRKYKSILPLGEKVGRTPKVPHG